MSCDLIRQSLLDLGWDAAARKRAAEVLAHLEMCPECRGAVEDYDRFRAALEGAPAADEPVGGWTAFEDRLIRAAKPQRPMRIGWLAAAAAIVLSAGAFEAGRWLDKPASNPAVVSTGPITSMTQPAFSAAHFEPHEITHAVNAFGEVSKVFDGRASWMLVSHDTSDVGVASQPVDAGRKVLLLRLTVTRGGQMASDADLLVIPGQTANLTVPIAGGQSLRYRIGTSTDEPTRLTVWLEVATPHGGEPLGALSTNLNLDPGQKVTAGQLATTAGEYELKIAFSRASLPEAKP